ncbi:MAG: hypothetical protein DRO87_11635 [Candidatus Thorarchaeota archaeon]|nr:MAG: hypothetical protein DRO87_11635 [Candidatus Thorarchaeota archaeon]
MRLPIQEIMKQFAQDGSKDRMQFACDFLREKYNATIISEPYYLTNAAYPEGRLVLFANAAKLTNGLYNKIVMTNDNEVVCVGPKQIPLLTKESGEKIDWSVAYAEEYVVGEPIMVYDHKNKPFIATSKSPKGKNIVPDKKITYYLAVCNYLAKRHDPPTDVNNVLYLFDPNYFYHLVYQHGDIERLVLVSATYRDTLREVSNTKLEIMAEELKVDTPDYDMVVSYTDVLNYYDGIKKHKPIIFIKDGIRKFKVKGE